MERLNDDTKLVLKFDPNTISHLGISLYSQLPSVLSELISNSWDADANSVTINFIETKDDKKIVFSDDGEGMTFEELNSKYLVIGRNRRIESKTDKSSKGRPTIGKKGLGKLSVFGICDTIEVESRKNGLKNHFEMDLKNIQASKNSLYTPVIICHDTKTDEPSGTTLRLKKVRRKSGFDLNGIALSIAKKFLIFDKLSVKLKKNDELDFTITNQLKYTALNEQFRWDFPNSSYDEEYEYWSKIKGSIITLETPVKDTELRGIYLTSRGKIVNTASFYGARDNDQFHNYVTGYLEVDFIEEFDEDVISTDRHSLNWEHDKTKELKEYLQKVIKKIGNDWKLKRSETKKALIENERDIKIDDWQNGLAKYEKDLSNKIINPILENANIDVNDSAKIIEHVIDKFENKTFKEYASHIAEISTPEQLPKLIMLMDEWKSVEAKQFRDIAHSRIEVIKQFESYIRTNTREVPTLHNFLKKFSWLLDPRILEFRDEVTYSQLLKETYPEAELDEQNKRIDFLCSTALGEIMYVIEIKRSTYKIDSRALEQAYEYGSFLKDKYASETGFKNVVCYVVGGEKKSEDRLFRSKEETYSQSGQVFVKTYRELLEQSREYHKEFIDAYNEYN